MRVHVLINVPTEHILIPVNTNAKTVKAALHAHLTPSAHPAPQEHISINPNACPHVPKNFTQINQIQQTILIVRHVLPNAKVVHLKLYAQNVRILYYYLMAHALLHVLWEHSPTNSNVHHALYFVRVVFL